MQISSLQAIPIALPFRRRYRTASGELSARSMIVVRLRTESGHVGLGEAVPLTLRGGPSLGEIAAELNGCAPLLTEGSATTLSATEPAAIRAWIGGVLRRCRSAGVGPQVIAALDIALHDLAGRVTGLPAWRLLGAATLTEVRCNATIDAGEPEAVAELAAQQRAAGFETFKIKVGTGADVERVVAVRRAVGSAARIRVDANGVWPAAEAPARLRQLESSGIELAEQPSPSLQDLAWVRARTAIPIVADESVASIEQAHAAIAARACDAATLKLAKVGGPLEALRIAAVIPSFLSSALDGPIGIAAAVHTAQALPRSGYAARFDHGLATLGMFSRSYASSDGLLAPSVSPRRAPGIGVEIDDRALEEMRLT
jgi:L-Ala-D/L-Glu epimerase